MPVTYSVDHRRQRVHAVASGTLTLDDVTAYIAGRVKDGVYDYDQLVEVNDATFEVESHEVLETVLRARKHLGQRPIPYTAVVGQPGTAPYGFTRQIATLFDFEGAVVHIVDSVREANAWLDEMRSGRKPAESNGST